ncbi:MAG: SpoIID/LytB domain-containing protein [candidate division WOR-3 bacterium]|nr:SpoIID/LytB domain-containing protein [candidate division WOR-3 bacterium]MCX7757816.1 SpoIID/LytB domain-containing protein [candidate division WOR-3 bacterium]MDW7987093.1 SpoIID/LytB domain-containing protein [candidate division WOR-3 bacterium]
MIVEIFCCRRVEIRVNTSQTEEPEIRVAVLWDIDTVYIVGDSSLIASNTLQKTRRIKPNAFLTAVVKADSIILLLAHERLLTDKQEIILQSSGNIKIGRYVNKLTSYYSKISIKKDVVHRFFVRKPLTVVNILPLEKYLYGVVSCELGTAQENEIEALKAQAVIARSYAVALLKKKKDFDLYGSFQYDQEYQGAEREYRTAKLAVDATCGEVLRYAQEIAFTQYHACCGGKTTNGRYPYLRSIIDSPKHSKTQTPFCAGSPYYNWKVKLDYRAFLDTVLFLAGIGYKFYFIPELIVDKKTGRVNYLKFTADKEYKVSGEALRKVLNLRSTFFSIKKIKDSLEITGKGWGHGIGLCQHGALAMARRGYSYREILRHYYYNTKLAKIY